MADEWFKRYQKLRLSRPHPNVLKVEMNRPERLNATDEQMHLELVRIWRDADEDPAVNAIMLTGVGKAFSAGGDFEMLKGNINEFDQRAARWKQSKDLVYNMINCSKPIISAIRGAAAGAGLTCGMLADIPIATKTAKIVDGHTRLGVAAGDHAAIIWPLLCGMAKSKYYLLLCEAMSGEEAERIGLVALAVDDADLEARSLEVAVKLAEGAQTAIRWTKYALNNWLRMAGPTFDTSLALEFMGFGGSEVKEGLAGHLEKRPPNFSRKSPI
jgi:enoyl-CoA hydratase